MKVNPNYIRLIMGSGLAQVIHFVCIPIVARFYGPEEFGKYEVFINVINILGVFSLLQYDKALLLPTEKNEFENLLSGTIKILVLNTLFFALIVVIVRYNFMEVIPLNYEYFYWAIPIVVFLRSCNLILIAISNRFGDFKTIGMETFIRSVNFNGGSMMFYRLKAGLIGAEVFTGIMSFLFLFFRSRNQFQSFFFKKNNVALVKYKDFPIYSLPKSLFFALTSGIPVLLITNEFGFVKAGLFGLATRILSKPVVLFANSASMLFKKEVLDEMETSKSSFSSVKRSLSTQIKITAIPALLGYATIDYIFIRLFPEDWLAVIPIIKCLGLMYILNLIVSPITFIFIVYKKQRLDFFLNVLLFFATSCSFYMFSLVFDNFIWSMYAYSIVYSLFYIVFLILSIKISKINEVVY